MVRLTFQYRWAHRSCKSQMFICTIQKINVDILCISVNKGGSLSYDISKLPSIIVLVTYVDQYTDTVKPVTRGHQSGCLNCIFCEPKCTCNEGTHVMLGHLLKCPLITGFTVLRYIVPGIYRVTNQLGICT